MNHKESIYIYTSYISHIKNPGFIRRLFGLSLIWVSLLGIAPGCASKQTRMQESIRHYEYGLLYLGNENWPQAYTECDKAVRLNSENDSAHYCLGISLYFQGKFEEAVLSYQRAIEINPQIPQYYNNIAAACAKLKKWEDVIRYSRTALETPSYSTPEFAYYNLGSAYLNLGKTQEAVESFYKSRTENPQYIDTHMQLGKALIHLKDFQAAIESLNEAKRLEAIASTNDKVFQAEIEYCLGQSFFGIGDLVSAKAAFLAAINKDPKGSIAERSTSYLNDIQKILVQQ
ncbi:tetratricopeptide repeat protein [bacterium]|nr:tetratricopeptide repeat protein [bacterium]